MSRSFIFSKTALDKVMSESQVFEVSDPSRPGMRCRVRPSGTKSVYVIKSANRKRIKFTVGQVPELGGKNFDLLYREALAFIESGLTVKEAKLQNKLDKVINDTRNEVLAFSLGEAIGYTKKNRRKKGNKPLSKNSLAAYDRLLKNHVSDWDKLPIRKLSFDSIKDRHQVIAKERGKAAANHYLRLLRSVWNFISEEKEQLGLRAWPKKRFEALWYEEKRRKTFIAPDHLADWYEGVMGLSDDSKTVDPELAQDYLLFAICTGLRRREITHSLLVENVDLDRGVFSLSISKADRVVELPTNSITKEVLERRLKAAKGSRVFPIEEPKKFIKRVAEASKVSFTSHDLRRCFASYANQLDVPIQAIKAFLTHASGEKSEEVTDGYIVMDVERLRVYSQRIADFIMSQSKSDKPNNVVSISEVV